MSRHGAQVWVFVAMAWWMVVPPAMAEVLYMWCGGASGKWNDAANWVGDGVPDGGDVARFEHDAEITDDVCISRETLTIERGGNVSIRGVVSGEGALAAIGAGTLHLYGENCFSGGFSACGTMVARKAADGSGSVHLHHGSALGSATAKIDCTTGPWLFVDGGLAVTTGIELKSNSESQCGRVEISSPGDLEFAENVSASGRFYLYGAGGSCGFRKGLKTSGYTWLERCTVVFRSAVNLGTLYCSDNLRFEAPEGNEITRFYVKGVSRFHGENAFATGSLRFGRNNSFIDLNGFGQTISYRAEGDRHGAIWTSGCVGYSCRNWGFDCPAETPAVFTYACHSERAVPTVWWGNFKNGAGLCFNPANGEDSFVFSNTVQTTTGDLVVSNGTVKVTCGAGLPSLNLLAVGPCGKFVLDGSSSETSARRMELAAGAKLEIGAGAILSARCGTIDGKSIPPGLYRDTSGRISGGGELRLLEWAVEPGLKVIIR